LFPSTALENVLSINFPMANLVDPTIVASRKLVVLLEAIKRLTTQPLYHPIAKSGHGLGGNLL
jgi:hypothetical protein